MSSFELDALIRRAQAEQRLPSVAAAVAREGELVSQGAVGLADVESEREATPETQYRVGSITKTFTAAAVMELHRAGRLGLDDRVDAFLSDIPHGSPTLRRLLAHLSGLQREPAGEIWESLELPDRETFFARLGEAEQVLDAGVAWHYSNLAYALLGEVVEAVSGEPYRDYVDQRLIRAAGLERTTWDRVEPAANGYFVDPYSDAAVREPDVDLGGIAAAGQLWSTVGDLCRWAAFLSRKEAEPMRTLQAMSDVERWTIGWGLGLGLYRRGDRIWAGHDGSMPGHLAAFVFRADDRVAAAVLTNSAAGALPGALAVDLGEASLAADPPAAPAWRAAEPPPLEVASLLGRWWSEGEEFVFRWRRGRLEVDAQSLPEHRRRSVLAPDGDDRWRVISGRERGELLRVERGDGGEAVKLYWATYPFTRAPRSFGE